MSNSEDTSSSEAPLSTEWGGDGGGVKRCSKCRETKPLAAFSKNKSRKDGLNNNCKGCTAEYRATNADAIREYNRAYKAANAEAVREYDRAYRAANADTIRVHKRAYRAANADTIRAQARAYNAANAEAYREYARIRRATYPQFSREQSRAYRVTHPDLYRASESQRRARLKGNGGIFTTQELKHMRAHQGGFCAYCQQFHGDALTIDHIVPLKQGGRHETANICLACPRCNSSKQDRTPDQWLNRWYWDWGPRDPGHIPPYWYE